jgi:hypothetical protein
MDHNQHFLQISHHNIRENNQIRCIIPLTRHVNLLTVHKKYHKNNMRVHIHRQLYININKLDRYSFRNQQSLR